METTPVIIKPNSKQYSIPISLKIFFAIIYILLSQNYGFFENKNAKTELLVKSFYLFQSFFASASCLTLIYLGPMEKRFGLWYTVSVTEYFLYVLMLMFNNPEQSFAKLQDKLIAIDSDLSIDTRSHHLGVKIISYYVSIVLIRLSLVYFYCCFYPGWCITPMVARVLYNVTILGLDSPLVMSFFVFYSVYCRLKCLNQAVKKAEPNVVFYHYIYKSLAHALEIAMKTTEKLLALAFLYNVPSMMVSLYYCLYNMSQGQEMSNILLQYVPIALVPVLVCAPAVAASWLASEVGALYATLHDRLLLERGEGHTDDLRRFARYIRARPLKFSVFKIVALDATLPVALLNVCITYMIVVVQLTHLY